MLKPFNENDIFHNQIKTKPNVNLKIYDRFVYLNNHPKQASSSRGAVDLYQNNIDRPIGQRIYPFLMKDGSLLSFNSIDIHNFNNNFTYGNIITGSYPMSASVSFDRFILNSPRPFITALRNSLDRSVMISPHFAYSSSFGDKSVQELRLISIPSIFYGSSIDRGSVSFKWYLTGSLFAQLVDEKRNGELRQKFPQDANSGSVGGLVMYNEGFILLTGSWGLHPVYTDHFDTTSPASTNNPRWIDFSTTGSNTPSDLTNVPSSSFEIEFNGVQYVPVITMFAHAGKGELNYSANPTFLSYGQIGSISAMTNSVQYKEHDDLLLKNIVKTNFLDPTGSFIQTVYISKVGIYDKDKNLIGMVKLAQPVRKRVTESFSIKMKLDIG